MRPGLLLSCALPLLAAAARAQLTAPAMTAPPARASVRELHDRFIEAVDPADKQRALQDLTATAPTSAGDVDALYDLFMRFADDTVRQATVLSLEKLNPGSQNLEPLVMRFLTDEDPASVIFGIKCALRLRAPSALPVIEKLAKPKIKHKQASDITLLSQRNRWWLQYEALGALAEWKGAEALPLLQKRAKEAPAVAALIASHMWEQAIPLIFEWSKDGADGAARAAAALKAPVPAAQLRASRERMLAAVRDPQAPPEVRHQFAIKIGLSSVPDEVPALLKEHDEAKDLLTRKLFAVAAFATRDMRVVPLLTQYSQEDPDPIVRAGARVQLKDMLPAAQYRSVLEWAVKNDPDAENRAFAQTELDSFQ